MNRCNCFIHKNNKELRKKLRKMGYLDNTCFPSFDNFLYTMYGDYYTCKDYNKFCNMRSTEFVNNCIDCDDNDELFLAIASLQNNSDYIQLFIDDNGLVEKVINDMPSKYMQLNGHKMDINEILRFFK